MAVDPKDPSAPDVNVFVSQLCEELRALKARINFLETQTVRAPGTEVLTVLPSANVRKGKLATFDPVTGDLLATAPASGTPEDMSLAIAAKLARDGSEAMTGNLRVPGNVTLPLEVPPLQQVQAEVGASVETFRGTDSRISQLPALTYADQAYSGTIVKLENGRLLGWGRGTARNLGTGNDEDGSVKPSFCQFAPKIPDGVTVAGFLVGSADSFVWLSNGWVYHAGLNTRGIGGHGATGNKQMFTRIQFFVTNSLSVTAVSCSSGRTDDQYSCAMFLCSNGDVYFSGYTDTGTAGDGLTTQRNIVTPSKVLAISGISGITTGAEILSGHYAWNAAGQCWSWGFNSRGHLGLGTPATTHTPAQIPGILVQKVVSRVGVNTGNDRYGSTLFLLKDGTVKAAGWNFHGQLGDNSTTDRNTPVTVSGLTGVVDVGIGGGDIAWGWAVTSAKQLWQWGSNAAGAIGIGNTTNQLVPVQPVGWIDEADVEVATGAPPFQGKVAKVITGKMVTTTGIGTQNTIVLDEDGNVWSSGTNLTYAIGWNAAGSTNRFKRASLMGVPPGDKIVDIYYQGHASTSAGVRLFALTQRGKLLGSGLNSFDLITALPNTSPTSYRAVFLQQIKLGV